MQNSKKLLYFVVASVFVFILAVVGMLTATRSFQESPIDLTPLPDTQTSRMRYLGAGCKTGGCSNTICVDETAEDPITTCEYKNEYACYKFALCEKQADGQCGWTQTEELKSCLANPPTESPDEVDVSI